MHDERNARRTQCTTNAMHAAMPPPLDDPNANQFRDMLWLRIGPRRTGGRTVRRDPGDRRPLVRALQSGCPPGLPCAGQPCNVGLPARRLFAVSAGTIGMTQARPPTHTFRSPCAYCSTIVREGVECSGPYDAEGHATFDGGVECFVCVLIVCADCLPPWVGVGSATTAPSGRRCDKTGGLSQMSPLRSPYVFVRPKRDNIPRKYLPFPYLSRAQGPSSADGKNTLHRSIGSGRGKNRASHEFRAQNRPSGEAPSENALRQKSPPADVPKRS